jgi:CxxC motif-containing protein
MKKELTCLACPRGCSVSVRLDATGEILALEGCGCSRGAAWVREELLHPMRTLTTTVRTSFEDFPRLPVRTERDIELQAFAQVMERIDLLEVTQRVLPGEVISACVYEDRAGQVALIATGYML